MLLNGKIKSFKLILVSVAILSRPDLMDNYLALVLSSFITNGLLEVSLL